MLDLSSIKKVRKKSIDYISIQNSYTFFSENFAEYRLKRTDDYNVINILFGLSFFKNIKCTLAANNIMNIEYGPYTQELEE